MIQQDHLLCYDLILTTASPLFVGNGTSSGKKEYLVFSEDSKIAFLKEDAFLQLLIEHNLIDAYENFILSSQVGLYPFLTKECHLSQKEIQSIVRYSVDAKEVLHTKQNRNGCEIHRFQRNAAGEAYVPGSSVKGALRTMLLTDRILSQKTSEEDDLSHGNFKENIDESRYLHTLSCTQKSKNAVNSVMRGIQISDSQPIPDSQMMLGRKWDMNLQGEVKGLNVWRECVRPGAEIHFQLTLDQTVLQRDQITKEYLLQCIDRFDDYYYNHYHYPFPEPNGAFVEDYDRCFILGGGAGYFSKTVTYPYYGKNGVQVASNLLSRFFKKHHHERDMGAGISPRTLKYTKYQNALYPFGICKVEIR